MMLVRMKTHHLIVRLIIHHSLFMIGELLSGATHATAKAAAKAASTSSIYYYHCLKNKKKLKNFFLKKNNRLTKGDFFACDICGQAIPNHWGIAQHKEVCIKIDYFIIFQA